MNLIFFSNIIVLILGMFILSSQMAYDITILPPMYNGVYITTLYDSGNCTLGNVTRFYHGSFQFLENICKIRNRAEVNILNCYGSSTDFLMNFRLFRWTSYIIYTEGILVTIVTIFVVILGFTKSYRKRLWHTIFLFLWIFLYLIANIIMTLTFLLYIIFRYKLGNESLDPIPKYLSINLLITGSIYMGLCIYNVTAFILNTYFDLNRQNYTPLN